MIGLVMGKDTLSMPDVLKKVESGDEGPKSNTGLKGSEATGVIDTGAPHGICLAL